YLSAVVLAGGVVSALGTEEQRAEVLEQLSSGGLRLALAHAEPGSRWRDGATAVTASSAGTEWRLTGVKAPVPHGDAEMLVVTAALPDGGTGAFLVAGDATTRSHATAYDGTRVSRVVLDGAVGVPLGDPGADATATIGAALDRARIIACHEA